MMFVEDFFFHNVHISSNDTYGAGRSSVGPQQTSKAKVAFILLMMVRVAYLRYAWRPIGLHTCNTMCHCILFISCPDVRVFAHLN